MKNEIIPDDVSLEILAAFSWKELLFENNLLGDKFLKQKKKNSVE